MTIQTSPERAAPSHGSPTADAVPVRSRGDERATWIPRRTILLAIVLVLVAALVAPLATSLLRLEPSVAWAASFASAIGIFVVAATRWTTTHIRDRGRLRHEPESTSAAGQGDRDADTDGLPSVAFRTEGTKRRYVPLASPSSELLFSMPTGRIGQRSSATISIGALPDTVTCGAGYLEVLWATEDGFVVNEIRTRGDDVIVTALPGPSVAAESVNPYV